MVKMILSGWVSYLLSHNQRPLRMRLEWHIHILPSPRTCWTSGRHNPSVNAPPNTLCCKQINARPEFQSKSDLLTEANTFKRPPDSSAKELLQKINGTNKTYGKHCGYFQEMSLLSLSECRGTSVCFGLKR